MKSRSVGSRRRIGGTLTNGGRELVDKLFPAPGEWFTGAASPKAVTPSSAAAPSL